MPIRLSVVIPSYKDPLLHKTIASLLDNSGLGDALEVIPVLDGYWPAEPIVNDPRVRVVHLGANRGMRGAINAGLTISRGEFVMRTDEHCMFAERYDLILSSQCQSNWIMTPRRYYLDPIKWEVMDAPCVDYEELVLQTIGNVKKFTGFPWEARKQERADIAIDETMAMQGSCWVMPRAWWDKVIGELQSDDYGTHYQDSHEMVFKTWRAGGKLMVNKNTWFAHKHVSFPRLHRLSHGKQEKELDAFYQDWADYYREVKRLWRKSA